MCTLLRSGRVYFDKSKIIDFPTSTMGRHLLAVSAHCGQVQFMSVLLIQNYCFRIRIKIRILFGGSLRIRSLILLCWSLRIRSRIWIWLHISFRIRIPHFCFRFELFTSKLCLYFCISFKRPDPQ